MREGVEIILWIKLMLHHPKHSHQGTVSFQNLQTFVQSRFGFPGFEAQTKKGKKPTSQFYLETDLNPIIACVRHDQPSSGVSDL